MVSVFDCKELLNSKKVVIIINIQKSKQVTMRGRIYGNDDSLSWWISGGGRANASDLLPLQKTSRSRSRQFLQH